ncbi:predicted protein [Histoplasma capsulatum G186AR]|uniref:Uncharacterized protein n=1 Tax=Ajellomyces capsulatus (strain G186AR / H82 / ATCC MYA-2454 / RMSCC 2432) TaxID=447093 RepID=C0NBJ0_AJECG|nr:uncharacterized protein HCBG_00486 [Histoplasma capsulatum G186AR]EEH11031.1 predicted protein [Histoplasma capsulatum G186AR]
MTQEHPPRRQRRRYKPQRLRAPAEVVTEDREKLAARQATRKNRLSQPPLLAPRPPCLPDYYWRRGTYSAGAHWSGLTALQLLWPLTDSSAKGRRLTNRYAARGT